MTDIYVGDIIDIMNSNPALQSEPFMTMMPGVDLEAAIGNISVAGIEGLGEKPADTEPIPDPLEDAARYEKRRVVLGRAQSLLTGGLGALGTPPVRRTSLLGRRL